MATETPGERTTFDNGVAVLRRLRSGGHRAFFAGGCVRDHLRGRTPADFDVATSARPEEVEGLFRRTIAVGKAFGVVRVACKGDWFEVATFRRDGAYADGRRPESVTYSDEREDAARRDFTINGMFWDPDSGEILDYVGGRADLERGVIRAIGDPDSRIQEDALRLLRAVRFAAREDFTLDPATEDAVRRHRERLAAVSPERIREELFKLAKAPSDNRALGVALISRTGLLDVILPEVVAVAAEARRIVAATRLPGLALMLAGMLARALPQSTRPPRWRALAEVITERLRLSNEEHQELSMLLADRVRVEGALHATPARRRLCAARAGFDRLHELVRAQGDADAALAMLDATRAAHPVGLPPPLLDGNRLAELGIPRGPRLGLWIRRLRVLQLGGRLPDAAAAQSWVSARLHGGEEDPHQVGGAGLGRP